MRIINFASAGMVAYARSIRERLVELMPEATDPIKYTDKGLHIYDDNISILIKVLNKKYNQREVDYFSSIISNLNLSLPYTYSIYNEGSDLIYSLNIKSR